MPVTNTQSIWLRFGAFLSPSPRFLGVHWTLSFRPTPHAPRPTPHAPPAGSGRARTLPRWRVPDTDRRIEKDGTGPDLEERPLYFIMSPNQAIPVEKSILFPPLVAVGP